MCYRLKAQSVKRVNWQTENEGIELGDLVSFRGLNWRLLDYESPDGGDNWTTVLLRDPLGKQKDVKVSFDLVRPRCIDRPQLGLPQEDFLNFNLGDAIAYYHTSGIQIGMYLDTLQDGAVYMQQYEPSKTVLTTWVLMWQHPTDPTKTKRTPSLQKCPTGYVQATITVKPNDIIAEVQLDGRNVLSEISRNLLIAKGIDI
jgi:hypothetical protein